jgi:hypothetical protein
MALVANWVPQETLGARRMGYDRTLEITILLFGLIKHFAAHVSTLLQPHSSQPGRWKG